MKKLFVTMFVTAAFLFATSDNITIPSDELENFYLLKSGSRADISRMELILADDTDNLNTTVFGFATDWNNGVSVPLFCFRYADIGMLIEIASNVYVATNMAMYGDQYVSTITLSAGRFGYFLKNSRDSTMTDCCYRINMTKVRRNMELEIFTAAILQYQTTSIIGQPSLMIKRDGLPYFIDLLNRIRIKTARKGSI